MEDPNKEYKMRQIIEQEGGTYKGIWQFPGNPLRDLVLFNDKDNFTLALYVIEFDRARVRAKLRSKKAS